ncbi:hypothetical protein [Aliivibrio fischeri]|uniref:hypothetical protein n=1 Tax=Aliivibrio fischeri TaxID=668 RepID=UPI0012DA7516|nr:hypothetical protein [Aliivibrio fischeri]MUJ39569.1 hypothetical protein [Aliivibrio fischeri]
MKKLVLISLLAFLCIPWVNALGGKFTLSIDTKDGHTMVFYADRGRFKSQITYKNKVKEVRGYYAVLFDTIYFWKSSRHILTGKNDFDLHEFLRENKNLTIFKLGYKNNQLTIKKISEDPRLGIHILDGELFGTLGFHENLTNTN